MSTIRVPRQDILVDDRMMATQPFETWMDATVKAIPSYSPLNINDFGGSDTEALQAAINKGIRQGGATIIMPPRTYNLGTVTRPAGAEPITILGFGDATILKRSGNLEAGKGVLNVFGGNFTLDSLLLDGNVTTPVGLLYNADFLVDGKNDPLADSLTRNTSVWLHGGVSNFTAQRVTWQHSGGYSLLADAMDGGIEGVRVVGCRLLNNRPNLFGIAAGSAIYGSWTGGILFRGDGRTANAGRVIKRMTVSGCEFLRNTGNCIWMHALGFNELSEDVQFSGNYFLDCGLDGILVGAATGGAVIGNVFRRVGYTTLTDTDRSIPRWLQNVNATALDSSGLVKSVVYANNSMLSVNGGAVDMDGHGLSVVTGTTARIPYPDEPEYDEDSIAISGLGESGSTSYGINISNTSATPYGAADLTITGNSLINLKAGAIRLFATRRCFVTANSIIAPSDSIYAPVGMGPIGSGPNQRCYDNKVAGNKITYNPAAAAPAIIEDDTYSAFLPTEKNTVCNNVPIAPVGTLATEFLPSPNSGSVHYAETVWFP